MNAGRISASEHAQPEGLRTDTAGSVENASTRGHAEFLEHLGESTTLADHARFPIGIEEMVVGSQFVVECSSHPIEGAVS